MSPGVAHEDKIAGDQQQGADQRSQQESPLSDPNGTINHPEKEEGIILNWQNLGATVPRAEHLPQGLDCRKNFIRDRTGGGWQPFSSSSNLGNIIPWSNGRCSESALRSAKRLTDSEKSSVDLNETPDLIQPPKMNSILTIEPTHGTFVTTETQPSFSGPPPTFETAAEPGSKVRPDWWSNWKFEKCFEAFIAILSVAYLIGAIGFGGLLLFYTLSR
jgi:hypothetical protein